LKPVHTASSKSSDQALVSCTVLLDMLCIWSMNDSAKSLGAESVAHTTADPQIWHQISYTSLAYTNAQPLVVT